MKSLVLFTTLVASGLVFAQQAPPASPETAPELTVDEQTSLFHDQAMIQEKAKPFQPRLKALNDEFAAAVKAEKDDEDKIVKQFEKEHAGWTITQQPNGAWQVVKKNDTRKVEPPKTGNTKA